MTDLSITHQLTPTRPSTRCASSPPRASSKGKPIDVRDTQIAGIAIARRAALATRNVRHFEDAGVDLVNPWK